jgi:uncharacterized protein YajQ (UPF0234 family)
MLQAAPAYEGTACAPLFCARRSAPVAQEPAMPAESTFDIVSEFDKQELANAVDQTQRDVRQRYDLKDSGTELALGDAELVITTGSEMYLEAVRDILQTKALRRNLSLKIFSYGPVESIAGGRARQKITLQQGIADDVAKRIQRLIKEQFPKVQARIQGDALRVASKNKDDLQAVIKVIRERADDFPVPLQFNNYR